MSPEDSAFWFVEIWDFVNSFQKVLSKVKRLGLKQTDKEWLLGSGPAVSLTLHGC